MRSTEGLRDELHLGPRDPHAQVTSRCLLTETAHFHRGGNAGTNWAGNTAKDSFLAQRVLTPGLNKP